MKVSSIKTHKITVQDTKLFDILDKYVSRIREKTILAITSKIVSICEGRVVRVDEENKDELVKKEAEYFLPPDNKYHFSLTIKNNLLIATAGIDESNGNGYYILWPHNPQETANKVRTYLAKRFGLKKVGVIITDSKTTPLRWGVTGAAIAHSGFAGLNDYRGKNDIFGRKLKVTQGNVMDGLAATAVLTMGEGKEQTPLAVIEDVPFVKFQQRNPTQKELRSLKISLKEDLYRSLLIGVKWHRGST